MGQKAKEGDKRIRNEFWKARLKDGRGKIFEKPENLWTAANDYFQWVQENPLYKNEAIKSGDRAGDIIQIPIERPMTVEGMCIYLDISVQTFHNYGDNKEDHKDYFEIVTRIREVIRDQKLAGAVIGMYNANIVARELGMADKKEVTGSMAVVWNETKKYSSDDPGT